MGGSYFLYCLDLLCFICYIIVFVYYTMEYYFDIVEYKMYSRSNYAYTKLVVVPSQRMLIAAIMTEVFIAQECLFYILFLYKYTGQYEENT